MRSPILRTLREFFSSLLIGVLLKILKKALFKRAFFLTFNKENISFQTLRKKLDPY